MVLWDQWLGFALWVGVLANKFFMLPVDQDLLRVFCRRVRDISRAVSVQFQCFALCCVVGFPIVSECFE